MADEQEKKKKESKGSLTAGIILLGLGLIFLLSNLDLIPDLDETWPLFLIIVGVALVIGALRNRDKSEPTPPYQTTEPAPPGQS
jgi:uncharacterized membrane protein HdeD (DUF308 family)